MPLTSPILICGAGVSGLALAQGLLKASTPFRLFERDLALNVRAQGYRVRINGVGIAALEQVLHPELLHRLRGSCAQVSSQAGNKVGPAVNLDALSGQETKGLGIRPPPGEVEPLNADRMVLRSVLVRGLEEYLEFGKEFSSYEITQAGVTVKFRDGSHAEGVLLVGADGIGSHVRKQLLPENVLLDTEGRWFYGKTPLTAELQEKFAEKALKGLTLITDRTHSMPHFLLLEPVRFKDNEFRSELPKNYVYWVLGSRKDFYNVDDAMLLKLPSEEAALLTQKLTAHWHPSFHALFTLQDGSLTYPLRILSATPSLPTWDSAGRVTLVGDAIHAMSPTAGVGATTAIRDAATLVQALRDGGLLTESVKKYEGLMREYAGEAIGRSVMGGKALFAMRPFEELMPAEV